MSEEELNQFVAREIRTPAPIIVMLCLFVFFSRGTNKAAVGFACVSSTNKYAGRLDLIKALTNSITFSLLNSLAVGKK